MITAASTTSVAAVIPAAVHSPRDDEEDGAAATAVRPSVAVAVGVDALGEGSWLSGGTRVPTGLTAGAALKPQSSSDAASR